MANGVCEACGKTAPLIRHHWYDTLGMDGIDHFQGDTVNNEPLVFELRDKVLYYHERSICLQCNRLLTQDQIRYFKGGGIKPFKQSDDSHIMPPWDIQKAFASRYAFWLMLNVAPR